jgi:hypothetical protein
VVNNEAAILLPLVRVANGMERKNKKAIKCACGAWAGICLILDS